MTTETPTVFDITKTDTNGSVIFHAHTDKGRAALNALPAILGRHGSDSFTVVPSLERDTIHLLKGTALHPASFALNLPFGI